MKKITKNSVIFIIAILAIVSFTVSCSVSDIISDVIQDILPDIPDISEIWDFLGFNKPANLQALAISDTQVFMTWDDKVSGEDGFKVEVSVEGGEYTYLATISANTASYFHRNLKAGTFYSYRVYAYDSEGNSGYSNVAFTITQFPLSTPPDDPTNLQAVALSDTQIELEWVDNSFTEDGFKIKISPDGSNFSDLDTADANATSYTSTNLTPETIYYYKIYAFNSAGNSGETDPANATTTATPLAAPDAPTNLQALTVSDMQIDLSWTDNSDNDAGFAIQISSDGSTFEPLDEVQTNVTSYESTSLMPETTYYYRVYASNSAGNSGYSNVASATTEAITDTVPDAPTNLQAKAASDTQIELGWSDNSDDEDGFNVEISKDGVNFVWAGKVRQNVTGYSILSLRANTTYWVRVNAYNFYGSSIEYSNVAKVTTQGIILEVPAPPSNLQAKAASDTMIEIGWTDNSGNEDGFNIEVSEDGINFKWIDAVKPDITGYSLAGLKPELKLWFRVNAFNRYGSSDPSNVADATTNPEASSKPSPPTNLQAKAVSDTQIALGWWDNSDNEEGFNIEFSLDGINFRWIYSVKPDVSEHIVEGLKPNYTFYFRVNAFNKYGPSGYSNVAKVITDPEAGSKPAPPSNMVAKTVSDTQIYLGWSDNSNNEEGFNIEISLDGTNFEFFDQQKPDVKEYLVYGLKPNYTFYFRVNAFNRYGSSAYTDPPAKATTNSETGGTPAAPSSLVARAVSDTQIWIGWTDNSDNEEGFNIEYNIDPLLYDWKYIYSVKADVKEHIVEGLKPNTTFYFRVNAFNREGPSVEYSNEASATTDPEPAQGSVPAAPTNLVAKTVSDTQIVLGWSDNSDNEAGFNIELSKNGTDFEPIASVKADVKEYLVEGLEPNYTFYFRVNAFNGEGPSVEYSNVAKATTQVTPQEAPNAPSSLVAKAVSDTQIWLGWTDNSLNEEGFNIEYNIDPLLYDWKLKAIVKADVKEYTVEGLRPETTYYFRVNAFNKWPSKYSNEASATTDPIPGSVPAAPTNLVAKDISDTQIWLGWSDNSDNEAGFNIELSENGTDFRPIASVKPDIKEYTVEGLGPETTYWFQVNAFNGEGPSVEYSNVAKATTQITPETPPDPPSSLVAKAVSDTQIWLGWTDNSLNEEGFNIEYNIDPLLYDWKLKASVLADVKEYTVEGLRFSTTYWFRVNAFNKWPSEYSNDAKATTDPEPGSAPADPTDLAAKAISDTQIWLGWSDNSDNEAGFDIELSENGTDFRPIASVKPDIKEYTVEGLGPETTYWFKVRAFNEIDKSGYAGPVSETTQEIPTVAPIAPSSLVATARSDTQIKLTWTDNSDNEEGFNIEYNIDPDEYEWKLKATVKADETSYGVESLKPVTTYYFRVSAFNKFQSDWSNEASATTKEAADSPPAAPSGLRATAIGELTIQLDWTDNSEYEDSFDIEYGPDGERFETFDRVESNTVAYKATRLKAGVRYYFRIKASNKFGDSYSNVADAIATEK